MNDVPDILEATASPPTTAASEPTVGHAAEAGSSDDFDSTCDLDELTNYRHVPFPIVGYRRVRYRYVGPLKPRSFELPEDDE